MNKIIGLTLLLLTGCVNYKSTLIRATARQDVNIEASTENLTEGGVQANAKANAVENLGVNQ